RNLCWTGGEPLLQGESIARAVERLPETFVHSIETDGEIDISTFDARVPDERASGRVRYVMDVKCPWSGMVANKAFANLERLRQPPLPSCALRGNRSHRGRRDPRVWPDHGRTVRERGGRDVQLHRGPVEGEAGRRSRGPPGGGRPADAPPPVAVGTPVRPRDAATPVLLLRGARRRDVLGGPGPRRGDREETARAEARDQGGDATRTDRGPGQGDRRGHLRHLGRTMAIKGVTFDWWGTVVEIPAVRDIYDETMREIRVDRAAEALKAAGLPVSRRLLRRAYDAQTDLLLRTWNDLRDLSVEEQTRAYLGLLGVGEGEGREDLIRTLQDAFGSAIEARLPALYPDIGETLRALRDRGYRTGLIS